MSDPFIDGFDDPELKGKVVVLGLLPHFGAGLFVLVDGRHAFVGWRQSTATDKTAASELAMMVDVDRTGYVGKTPPLGTGPYLGPLSPQHRKLLQDHVGRGLKIGSGGTGSARTNIRLVWPITDTPKELAALKR